MNYKDEFRMYKVTDNETSWVVAKDAKSAIRAVAEDLGYDSVLEYEIDFGDIGCEELPPDMFITCTYEDDDFKEAMTACEWALNYRGVVGSTC